MAKRNDTLSFLVAPKLTMALLIVEAINKSIKKRKQNENHTTN